MNILKTFAASESGAVTVDWVVLTAAIVGLALAVMAVISGGVEDLTGEVQAELAAQNPNNDPFAGAATVGDANAID
ncbi:hypothetical protein HKCCE3408_02175 [Rhodobacterales bacterium HKCCE3408]|nr:hypothetical protein [Rhodobacterales bacterium HKCCE3408]